MGSSSNRYAPRLPQQETKPSTKQLAPTDPILGPENLLKTGFAQKGLPSSFWVRFWHLKLIWFLETELGPPLFEALIANAVFLCDADALLHWNSAAEEGAWGGLKTGPPRRHQIQPVEGPVLDPRAKETYLKRGQKVDPLEIKSGPPWRVQFWPLHCGKFVEAFISSWSWFDQQQLRLESWTVRGPYCQRGVFVWRWCASTLEQRSWRRCLGWA